MKVQIDKPRTHVPYRVKGLRKPSHEVATIVFLAVTVLVVASVSIGFFGHDMRPVIAAVYFAFGFAVQRASFCSATLISAVVLSRDRQGMAAIFTAVLTAMLGFGLMHTTGLITIYPGRVSLLPAAAGGLLFGIGMVLAGGCVSGSLFKATEGRWPSILAVMGIFLGMATGTSDWGMTLTAYLAEVGSSWNPAPNVAETGGASYSHLTTGVALIGLATVALVYRRRILTFRWGSVSLVSRKWSPFGVAVIVGLLGWVAFLAGPAVGRDYPLGASHIPSSLLRLALGGDIHLAGLLAWPFVIGSAISAWMRGDIRWRSAPRGTLALAFAGGVMVGLGATMAGGCFVGQILSGWALLASHALVFGTVMILANWVTTLLYLRGWRQ